MGELEDACVYVDRALDLNPNYAPSWFVSGCVRVWLGESDLAIEHVARARRLSPLDPAFGGYQNVTAVAHLFAGRYDEASSWATDALRETPAFLSAFRTLAASEALGGRLGEARNVLDRMLKLDPTRRISNLKETMAPFRRPQDLAKYVDGLRLAGLPE